MHVCISNCINNMTVSSSSIRFFFVILTVLNSRSSSFLFKRIQIVVDWNSCEDRMNNANNRYKILLYRILSNLSKIRHCSHIEMSQLVETQYQTQGICFSIFGKECCTDFNKSSSRKSEQHNAVSFHIRWYIKQKIINTYI